jgi:integrase
MTAPPAGAVDPVDEVRSSPVPAGLKAKLVAAVRPEFRAVVLTFDADDPVFGGPVCRVASCGRLVLAMGLCGAHHGRWKAAHRPDLDDFTASTSPRWRGQQYQSCQVPACQYASSAHGLCQNHYRGWTRAGRTPLTVWVGTQPAVTPGPTPRTCLISSCDLWTHAQQQLCFPHNQRWRRHRRSEQTDITQFAHDCDAERHDSAARVDLGCLEPQIRLEVQYALQCRRDQTKAKVQPGTVGTLARFLAGTGAESLLEHSEQLWGEWFAQPGVKGGSCVRGLLIYSRRHLEDLAYGHGWEVEYPRDVWRLHTLGITGPNAHLRFDRIPQPWLRSLAKRWIRWRLSTGISSSHACQAVAAITRFALFLAGPQVGVDHLADIDRALLERYLADLHTHLAGSHDHTGSIGNLNTFLQAIRRNGWDEGILPATAMFFTEDYPKPSQQLPRWLADHVMAQVEDPINLDKWKDGNWLLVTVILIRCGLRISDAAGLAFDCIVHDGDGAPYLRYYNHKMKREALVPIDDELEQMIKDHRRDILHRWPQGTPVLFPRTKANLDGKSPIGASAYRHALNQWLQRCDIRDEHAHPVHLTPHQWRHTLGTRLINLDVPQEVVRKILDHDSHAMTAHYARLQDTTIRRHWEQANKVNHRGEKVTLDPDGPLAEASWARQRISRATQALPNGYCGLPLVQTCPHANSCLTCPVFVTTPEFLPQHRAHHQQTLQIITSAEARGQTRLAEMNQQVANNLEKIITALEIDPDQQTPAADAS